MVISLNFEVTIREVDHNLPELTVLFPYQSQNFVLEGAWDYPMWQF